MSAQAVTGTTSHPVARPDLRGKLLWTAGNVLMLIGLYLLLYVGGLFADEQFNLMAAEGDSEIALPEIVERVPDPPAAVAQAPAEAVAAPKPAPMVTAAPAVAAAPAPAAASAPAPVVVPTTAPAGFKLPELNNPGGGRELNTLVPSVAVDYGPSTVTRVEIPAIKVNRKVVDVGYTVEEVNGEQVATWEVAKYAVGHHEGTANPGQGGNIVLAGHSGGRAYPFNEVYYLKPGNVIFVWSNGQRFRYTVTERLVLDEIGPNITMEQRRANARYIEPMNEEVVTLVTCWPLTGKNKFSQRVVIRAVPSSQ